VKPFPGALTVYPAAHRPHITGMSVKDIALMGNPVLDRRAADVADPDSFEVRTLVADMRDTLDEAGGIGLAAP